jgi:hypothetical protein
MNITSDHPYLLTYLVSTILWIIIYHDTKYLKEHSIECKIYKYFWNEELADTYNKHIFLIKLYIAFYFNIPKFVLYIPYYIVRFTLKFINNGFKDWNERYKVILGIYVCCGSYGFYLWSLIPSDPNVNIDNISTRFFFISVFCILCSLLMIAIIAYFLAFLLVLLIRNVYNKIINNNSKISIIK